MKSTLSCFALLSCLVAVAACDKKSEDIAPTTTSGAAAPAPATGGKKAKATLKLADMKSAYKSEVDNMAKMKDPMDKKVAAFVAKVGAPASDSGRKKTWYALDGANCSKVELDTSDGSLTDMTTPNADCGM